MGNNIFEELAKYNLEDCKTVTFDEDVYADLKHKHCRLNAELAIKEAASWEVAAKFVLTD